MSTFEYLVVCVALFGLVAVVTNHRAVRRWALAFYLLVIGLLAFGFFVAGVRPAVSELERMGKSWTPEAASGAIAMHHVDQRVATVLFVICIFLFLFSVRRPK